jgi:hypothetical protein
MAAQSSAHTAIENGAHLELFSEKAQVDIFTFEGESRVARDYVQSLNLSHRVDDLFGDSVGEVFVLWVRAHVGKRQYHDGIGYRGFGGRGCGRGGWWTYWCEEPIASFRDCIDDVWIAGVVVKGPAQLSDAAFLAAFLEEDWIAAAADNGCFERPPAPRFGYFGFVDPSGGRRDSFALGIAHRQGDVAFLDVAREWRAPLDPAVVTEECAGILKSYGISKVEGDSYSGEWCVSGFRTHGITYTASEKSRSDIYLEIGAAFSTGRVRVVDSRRLLGQLRQLERKTSPSGKDRVDHPPGGMDDVANAAAGALRLALGKARTVPGARRWAYAIMSEGDAPYG